MFAYGRVDPFTLDMVADELKKQGGTYEYSEMEKYLESQGLQLTTQPNSNRCNRTFPCTHRARRVHQRPKVAAQPAQPHQPTGQRPPMQDKSLPTRSAAKSWSNAQCYPSNENTKCQY